MSDKLAIADIDSQGDSFEFNYEQAQAVADAWLRNQPYFDICVHESYMEPAHDGLPALYRQVRVEESDSWDKWFEDLDENAPWARTEKVDAEGRLPIVRRGDMLRCEFQGKPFVLVPGVEPNVYVLEHRPLHDSTDEPVGATYRPFFRLFSGTGIENPLTEAELYEVAFQIGLAPWRE